MRSVYRLQGLVTRYGPDPVETACSRALDLDVVSVSKIAAMLAKATETQQPMLPACPPWPAPATTPKAAGSPATPASTPVPQPRGRHRQAFSSP